MEIIIFPFFLHIYLLEMIILNFKVGDIVTRKSHNNDIVFKIISIDGNVALLKGVDLRIYVDSYIDDLVLSKVKSTDDSIIEDNLKNINIDRDSYFYLPGKVLHIDGDNEYLDRCMNFYNKMGVKANGVMISENVINKKVLSLLKEYRPDILVITGHDAFFNRNSDKNNIRNYQNSINFVSAIKEARRYEKSQDKLIIIAGACQSNYEELIKAGANFASSPKRINIHALDPAIIASSIAFSDRNQSIDLINVIEKTKYGSDGIGGIITSGTMYVGYPR